MGKDLGNRLNILKKIKSYRGINDDEEKMRLELINFIIENPDCFKRSLRKGHVTGSALITDYSQQYILLTLHAKFDKWFQLGGHSDGNSDTAQVAYQEACEESGLTSIEFLSTDILDIDIQQIPRRNDELEHIHYDIRFLFTANKDEKLKISSESKDLQWVPIDRVHDLNSRDAMSRMILKLKNYK